MSTTQPRRITAEDPPQLPCWLWNPVAGYWQHYIRMRKPTIFLGQCTHWHPDQPEPPTCVPEQTMEPPDADPAMEAAKEIVYSIKTLDPSANPVRFYHQCAAIIRRHYATPPVEAPAKFSQIMANPITTPVDIAVAINSHLMHLADATPPASAPASGETLDRLKRAWRSHEIVGARLLAESEQRSLDFQRRAEAAEAKLTEVEAQLAAATKERDELASDPIYTQLIALRSRLALADELAGAANKLIRAYYNGKVSLPGFKLVDTEKALTRYNAAKEGQQ